VRFVDPQQLDVVCLLSKSLHGLKQASCVWFNQFVEFVVSIRFALTRSLTSLFVYQNGACIAYLLLYIDDMILTASSLVLLCLIITKLQSEFTIKDMGAIRSFLGIAI
jgi:hypothetical protein